MKTLNDGPIVWVTNNISTFGDKNARVGVAEHIVDTWVELPLPSPSDFLKDDEVKSRLIAEGLTSPNNTRWPDVIIGATFHIPYMQAIKRLSEGNSIVVGLRPPVRNIPLKATKNDIDATDIIVSYPHLDNSMFKDPLICNSLPNRVSTKLLEKEGKPWIDTFNSLGNGGPIIGVLVGGNIGKRKIFSDSAAIELASIINTVAKNAKASIYLSFSPRTPVSCKAILKDHIDSRCEFYDPGKKLNNNPFFGILSHSDYIITTGDSISMCCEAVSSGKPVFIYSDKDIVEPGHQAVINSLVSSGLAKPLNTNTKLYPFTHSSPNSADIIACEVIKLLKDKHLH